MDEYVYNLEMLV